MFITAMDNVTIETDKKYNKKASYEYFRKSLVRKISFSKEHLLFKIQKIFKYLKIRFSSMST